MRVGFSGLTKGLLMHDHDHIWDLAERSLDEGNGLAGTGFWKAVGQVKRDPGGADLDRIAAIDRRAFEQWALLAIPIRLGTAAMLAATILGLLLVSAAYSDVAARDWYFLVGFGIIWVTTHGLGHLVVGTAVGMRFTHWFIGTLTLPQPGVKVDYATYLVVSAHRRAWMHASGAIVSKITPFALLPFAYLSGVSRWVTLVVAAFGVISIVTDILWSTKVSDWKKFRREMSLDDRA